MRNQCDQGHVDDVGHIVDEVVQLREEAVQLTDIAPDQADDDAEDALAHGDDEGQTDGHCLLYTSDKTEIVETARHINTFETSILPYEDCCTIFTPPHPKIRPELEEILEAEAGMPGLAQLETEAAEATERIRLRITDDVDFEG